MKTGPPDLGADRVILSPVERRPAIVQAIDSARVSVRLSMFRCTDFKVMDKLAEALGRGVRVELLLTRRAKGWEKKIRELGLYLESMGAQVHRYSLPGIKYHAKYLVVDDTLALVSSANPTLKCFEKTCDFVLETRDDAVISSLTQLFDQDAASPASSLPAGLSPRLIVGPQTARTAYRRLIAGATQSIRIVDHRVTDPDMVHLLEERQAAGIGIIIYGRGAVNGHKSHGKMMLIDGSRAVIGSISLSPPSLGKRRELAAVIDDPECVACFEHFLDSAGSGAPFRASATAAGGADDDNDDEDSEDERDP